MLQMKKKYYDTIEFDNAVVPIHIYKEFRWDISVSIKKDKAIIRIPIYHNSVQINKNIEWAKKWIINKLELNSPLKNQFTLKEYFSGKQLNINDSVFTLQFIDTIQKNFSAKLIDKNIEIKIPIDVELFEKQKAIKTLQSRIVAKHFQSEISERINHINKVYFNVHINSVKLKYNKSNWGSRSSKNNINISTRLLFTPKDVQDYVFIHELAHFKEMNHSKRFWKIVSDILPDYKEKEKWLKVHGPECDF